MDLIRFGHIEQLQTAFMYGKRYIHTPVWYVGTVKLHGTNSSVVCCNDQNIPQSRNRQLTIDKDNYGFALFVNQPKQMYTIKSLEKCVRQFFKIPIDMPITFFGELIGPGIQNGVGVCKLEERHWVLFGIKVGQDKQSYFVELDFLKNDNTHKILSENPLINSVLDVDSYEMVIDFQNEISVEHAKKQIKTLVQKIENECPYAKLHNINGVGEGIVWVPIGEHSHNSRLAFKSKGEKHSVVNTNKIKNVKSYDITKIESFVDYAVTENRMQQGLEYVKEMHEVIEMKNIKYFLKWLSEDIMRECKKELVDLNIEWKQVSKAMYNKARHFYINAYNNE